jgi:AcrR family transcriptional regulator
MAKAVAKAMRKGEETRERLLDIAEASILQKGFGATSIDEIIAAAGITKSGFFYHFADKNMLARALLRRSGERDEIVFDDIFGRARQLTDDPLQTLLVALKLLAETMADLPNGHPGCLVTTYCYQERLFDREVHDLNRGIVLNWRRRFRDMLDEIASRHRPAEPVDFDQVADMFTSIIEGGLVVGKAIRDTQALPEQILLYRHYVKLLFQRPVAA